MSFSERLAETRADVLHLLKTELRDFEDSPVLEAMRYALQGGKGLRAFLVMESARLEDVSGRSAIWAAAAIEAMHTYSLVHDDLPCMDDDDLRRGQPTIHVKWDQATAVLAGDALQSLAFELLTRKEIGAADRRMSLVRGLAKAAGARGMVLGQAQDIGAETASSPLTLEQITALQANKTGALFRWAATAGAKIAGTDPSAFKKYADAVGLAFQIYDDILDVEGDSEIVGKRLKKDDEAGKATFVSLLGLQGAKTRAHGLVEQACKELRPYGNRAETLQEAARFVISRQM